jgi:hypothetical protein
MGAIDAQKLCGSGDFFIAIFASRPGVSTELPRSRRETIVPDAPI